MSVVIATKDLWKEHMRYKGMYKDYKVRKDKISCAEKNVDSEAFKWFRATPYQLEYQRKYGIKTQASEHLQDNQEVTGNEID